MVRNRILIGVCAAALLLSTLACRVSIDMPVSDIKTGPTQTEAIQVAQVDGDNAEITLAFGAGELNLSPGAENSLVEGTATYNVADLKPTISVDRDRVRIETGELNIKGIPNFKDDIKNEWDLKLGSQPIRLHISAGAYQGEYELGGLALQSLEVGDGAADVKLNFSEPNLTEMSILRYETGASQVSLSGLANANFKTLIFRSGAGDYTLEFTGDLRRDSDVDIESGISKVTVIVPEGVSARVIFSGGLANIDTDGQWTKSGDEYLQEGSGPTLTINVKMGAGTLELRNR